MFTKPKIVVSDDLTIRSYVSFYLNRKRIREYNGNSLNLLINPNRADSISERNKLLRKLQFELHKVLEADCYPAIKAELIESNKPLRPTTKDLLMEALNKKLKSDLSKTYKRNLKNIHLQFTAYLNEDELNQDIEKIQRTQIDTFLSRFNSSGTYYIGYRFNICRSIKNQ